MGREGLFLKLAIVTICLAGLINVASCEEANLSVNSGFEEKTKSWNLWGLELPILTEQPHSGRYSLQAHDVEGGYSAGAWQWFKVEPGSDYVYTGWIKTNALKGEAWIEVQWFDDTNNIQIGETITSMGSKKVNDTMDWTKVEIEACAPPNAKIARIAFKVEGAGGYAYFDDAKVVKRITQ